MLVVADTSPLRYLIVIQAIEILPLLYERVVVPQAVLAELQHPRSPREVRAWLATPPAWVDIRPPQQRPRLARLGPGEQDAIHLAEELHAEVILMDDEDGRIEAERRAHGGHRDTRGVGASRRARLARFALGADTPAGDQLLCR